VKTGAFSAMTDGKENSRSLVPNTLFILSSLRRGGSETKTVRIINELRARGYPVHIAYLDEPDSLLSEIAKGVPCQYLHRKGRLSMKALQLLKSYIQKHSIEVVYCVNQYPLIYACLLKIMWRRRRFIVNVSINTTEFVTFREKIQMIIYAPMFRWANKVIFGCKYQEELWITRYRLNKATCTYIYNGVDEKKFLPMDNDMIVTDLRRDIGLGAGDFIIGMVASFLPVKQHSLLIEAVARLIDEELPIKVVFVGDGPLLESVKEDVRRRGLESHTRFLGQIQDVWPVLAVMDVFVLTSKSETFSNAALEAMSMGRPVVLSDVGGAREMVSSGGNGFLCSSGVVDELVSALKRLIISPGERLEMGRAARVAIEEQFSFEKMILRYEALLASPEH